MTVAYATPTKTELESEIRALEIILTLVPLRDWKRQPLSRVLARLKRERALRVDPNREVLRWGDLTLYPRRNAAVVGSRPVALTRLHTDILKVLIQADGQPVTRSDLLRAIWQASGTETKADHCMVITAIHRVRCALDPQDLERYIRTVRGKKSYYLAPVAETEAVKEGTHGSFASEA